MAYQAVESVERRRRILRIVLFLIILSTMPFYCAGFLLWGTAGVRVSTTETPLFTNTPIGGDRTPTGLPTLTPLRLTVTIGIPLQPTPLQFNPGFPGSGGNVPTQPIFIQPTAVFIPTSTLAPTLTPFPTNTQPPPPTLAPLPTDPPLPTNTPEPLPTEAPLPTDEPPPADAPPADAGTTP
jgi:hypothetical protein